MLSGSLDRSVTFSRGTNATLTDSTGKITYAPANLLTFSEQFDNAAWAKLTQGTGVAPVVTANFAVAPNGTMTADRVQLNAGTNGSNDYSLLRQSGSYPVPFIRSIWVKSNTGIAQEIALVAPASASKVTVPVEWTRVSQLQITSGALQLDLSVGGTAGTPATADILIWGAQLEPVTYQTTAGPYVATTSAAYYGPRFDYDPVTLAPRGLLIEEQRTNLLTYSEQFDNAAWTKSNAPVTANVGVAPDGTTTADKVTPSVSNTIKFVNGSPTYVAATAQPVTHSCYAKADGYSKLALRESAVTGAYVSFDLSTGSVIETGNAGSIVVSNATITSVGNGWYRLAMTCTNISSTQNNGFGIWPLSPSYTTGQPASLSWTGNGTSGIFIWGAQLEAGAFATSYIPTVASQVTRSADVATMTGTNFSSWYNTTQGTIFVSFTGAPAQARVWATTTTGGQTISDNDGGGNNARTSMFNVAYTDTGGTPTTTGLQYKIAYGYKQSDYASSTNGGTVQTSANATAPTAQSAVTFGSTGTANFLNGHIRQIAYYNTRLPNDQLQALTS
jgi:hypothetical protein